MTCLAIAVASLLSSPGTGRAQEALDCAPPASASDTAEARDEAFALYAQSRERYAEGDFATAVALLERAYARHAEPVLLYNLARTLEGMARWGEAADAYECYLRRNPSARDRGAIEQRVESLRRSDEATRLAPLPDDRTPVEEGGGSGRSLDAGPFALLGVGAATIAAGAIVGGVALGMRDEAQADPVHASAASTARTAEDYAITADVLWGVAGAMVVAGLVWGIVDWTAGSGEETVSVAVGVGVGTVSVDVRY